MPAPSSYTETTLKQFVVDELGAVGVALGLTTSSNQVTGVVYAVERLLGVSDVATLTDMAKIEALTRWQAWRAAKAAASKSFNLKAGPASVNPSERFDHISEMLVEAERAAMAYPEARAVLGSFTPVPYAGGLSIADRQSRERDTDRVQPFFSRTLHEPASAGEVV